MPSDLAKAAVSALALNGNGGGENPDINNNNVPDVPKPLVDASGNTGPVPDCPSLRLPKFHDADACLVKPARPQFGHQDRSAIHQMLKSSGKGASLVPNQQTIVCPLQVQSLENKGSVKGFDTTWIVENTATTSVVISWVVDGMEWSPFEPGVKAMDDPKAMLKPGEWTSVPTFESFVYHVRELDSEGNPANVLLQHRAGLIPLGNPNQLACDAATHDVEPISPETALRKQEFSRTPTNIFRPCNTIDLGFRNQAGCPLHIYWANRLDDIPTEGFSCGEKFRFHLGTKPATQDFMHDWESTTKFEGTFVGHTFIARLASDPNVVVDSYRLGSTKIVDCPNSKQQTVTASSHEHAEAILNAEGMIQPLLEEIAVAEAAMAGAGAGGMSR